MTRKELAEWKKTRAYGPRNAARMAEAKRWIEENYRSFPTLADVADGVVALNGKSGREETIGVGRLLHAFKAHFGYSPGSLIRRLRMAEGLGCGHIDRINPSRKIAKKRTRSPVVIEANRAGLPEPKFGWMLDGQFIGHNSREALDFIRGKAAA